MRIPFLGLEIKRVDDLSSVENRGGWFPLIREPFTGAWQANQEITQETQLAFYAVFACITLIANDIGKLRPRLLQMNDKGIWAETDSPAFSPVLRRPNRYQNHIQFKEAWQLSKLTRGNTYALKQRDNRGVVTATYILDPMRVRPLVAPDGSVYYELRQDELNGIASTEPVIVPASEIIHDRINCLFHPLVGVSPLYACGVAAGQGLAIQQQSSTFFHNGARPSGVLTAPGAIGQPTADRIKTAWQSEFNGQNAGRVAVLGDGLKYEPMIMSAADAQLIEQLGMTAKVVCSVFHVPPAKIGLEQDNNAANAQIRNQNYYSDCLQSHIEQFELAMDEGLGIGYGAPVGGRVLGVDLDLDGLLRMDSASQMTTLAAGIAGSVLLINEARAKLDLPAVPGGDQMRMQQQNYSLTALTERDDNDPFAAPPAPAPQPAPVPAPDPAPPSDDEQASKFVAALTKALEIA